MWLVGRGAEGCVPPTPQHSCSMCVLPKGSRELNQLSTRQRLVKPFILKVLVRLEKCL